MFLSGRGKCYITSPSVILFFLQKSCQLKKADAEKEGENKTLMGHVTIFHLS